MYHFGSAEDEVTLLLDSISSEEHTGPKCPSGAWQDMSLKQQEDYFVYLRLALDSTARDPIISEEAIQHLYTEYEQVFQYLANTDSKLRTAIKNGTHAFFMADNEQVVDYFRSLVKD